MNKKIRLLTFIILALSYIALITRNGDIILISVFFISYLLIGIVMSPNKEETFIKAKRFIKKIKKGNSFIVDVTVKIKNAGKKNVCFYISDSLQKGMTLIDGSLCLRTAIRPHENTELKYTIESLRGGYEWENIEVEISDPFECIITKILVEAYSKVYIQPLFKKIRSFPVHSWKTLFSHGNIPIQRGGSGTEFWGVRDYQPGDPLKSLDWRLTARYPHKFFTREFVLEKTTEIALVIDGRPNMNLNIGKESLFDIEVTSAASLSEMFLRQDYRVGLSIIGSSKNNILPNYGRKQLQRILNCLARINIEDEVSYDIMFNLPIKKYSSRILMIILSPSPVYVNDISFYRSLRSLGFQIVLVCPDTFDFAGPELNLDKTTEFALRFIQLERKLNLSLISHLFISVIDWKVSEPLLPLLKKTLSRPLQVKKA